jgi:hypothetical protein
MERPLIVAPFMESMARCASSGDWNSTKAKPRDCPDIRSRTTEVETSSPNSENASRSWSSVVE